MAARINLLCGLVESGINKQKVAFNRGKILPKSGRIDFA
jgi:hypothetical protein